MRRTGLVVMMLLLFTGTYFALRSRFLSDPTESFHTATAAGILPSNTVENSSAQRKKLIEYGWDVPSPDFLPANIQSMEQRPFDGIVVKLTVGPYIFTHTPYLEDKFTQDREDLKRTAFSRFTDNFLIIWASSEQGWNFLSDSDWTAAEQNLRSFARTAAVGHFKGILFDTETYGPNTWAYNTELYPNTTFEQVQGVVRQRGTRFMSILQNELPDTRVLFTWFLGKIRDEYDATGGKIAAGPSPLFGAFVEGMLSAVTGKASLIDGNEMSYNYIDAAAFDQSRLRLADNVNRVDAAYREAARRHVSLAQAIYADGLLNFSNSPRTISFYISNQQDRLRLVEHNVYHALRTSDEYVWFYSEKVAWWKQPDVPDGLEAAIRRAHTLYASGQVPSFDMHFLVAVNKALSEAPTISGRVLSKDGAPLPHVVIQSGIYNRSDVESACFSDLNNFYECKLPKGWSGTLTPVLKGYRFEPPVLTINNLTQSYHVDFTAIPVIP